MGPEVILLILVISIGVILPSILIPVSIYNKKYRNFVLKHSDAIKKLNSINEHYDFIDFKDGAFRNSYDNRNFYENISPRDYLIYQLVYIQKLAFEKMNNADANRKLFEKYKEEVASSCKLNSFDTEELLKNAKKLKRVEKKQFERRFLIPKTEYRIDVCLVLTNINKQYITSKRGVFDSQTIKSLIGRINNKSGEYYLDRGIWDAITRVERGKVSNRLRFRVYARDGHCCVKCGSRRNLEIDHIIPISKGGKTRLDNLQTLCHRCNMKKGSDIEYY